MDLDKDRPGVRVLSLLILNRWRRKKNEKTKICGVGLIF